MCDYCTCRELDNTRYSGMRLKNIKGDKADHQSDEEYTWNGAPVTNTADRPEPVPPANSSSVR